MMRGPSTDSDFRDLIHDFLDHVLGLQLGTEMFGPKEVVLQSPFAAYVIGELEFLAKAVEWNDEAYWNWRCKNE